MGNLTMLSTDSEELHSIKVQIDHDLNGVTSQLRRVFEDGSITCLDMAFLFQDYC